MKLTFIGTGEAFDETRANTSYLIENDSQSTLVDCGYTVPSSLRRFLAKRNKDFLDIPENIIITHFHGDHFAGLSGLLIPLWDQVRDSQRERKLTIASAAKDVKERVEKRMDEDYHGLYKRFKGDKLVVDFKVIDPVQGELGNLTLRAALTSHSVPNYAYRFEQGGRSFAISGDGMLSYASRELYQGIDLLVHEGFSVDKHSSTHASISEVVDYAITANISRVAIVHVNRDERKKVEEIGRLVIKAKGKGMEIFFPADNQEIELSKI